MTMGYPGWGRGSLERVTMTQATTHGYPREREKTDEEVPYDEEDRPADSCRCRDRRRNRRLRVLHDDRLGNGLGDDGHKLGRDDPWYDHDDAIPGDVDRGRFHDRQPLVGTSVRRKDQARQRHHRCRA